MVAISATIEALRIGRPFEHRNLRATPLIYRKDHRSNVEYELLDNALVAKQIEISEISRAGSVPEIQVRNCWERPVLILDGEELVGAKQNRILNLTVMVPPRCRTVLPVSCVEAGRWRQRSQHFQSSDHVYFAMGRARKADRVSASLLSRGSYEANQAEVWEDIDEKLTAFCMRSSTSAVADLYEEKRASIDEYVKTIRVCHESEVLRESIAGSLIR